MLKGAAEGNLIRVTKTHYVTKGKDGLCMWSKEWYRLPAPELEKEEPIAEIPQGCIGGEGYFVCKGVGHGTY